MSEEIARRHVQRRGIHEAIEECGAMQIGIEATFDVQDPRVNLPQHPTEHRHLREQLDGSFGHVEPVRG